MSKFGIEQVSELSAKHRVIPVIETLFAGSETPVSIFEKLAGKKPGVFLLESAEQGVWARYSFIGVNNRGALSQASDGKVSWKSDSGASALPDGATLDTSSALGALRQVQEAWTSAPLGDLPPLTSGLVGVMAWDLIREIENLPAVPARDFASPLLHLVMFEDLVVVDHLTSSVMLVANIFVTDGIDLDEAYGSALARIELLKADLVKPSESFFAEVDESATSDVAHRVEHDEFLDAVEKSKHFVRIGDVFQVVISQRFDVDCEASPLDVYRALRALNPSPYMYLLNFADESGEYSVVGSSPEALVQVSDGKAIMHPIAGSRPRGKSVDADEAAAESLLGDAKERAEHLMLVDLARNDLLKVCEPNSVSVSEFMAIHRFSHIMHLVSTVEGQVRGDQGLVDVFKATFPAGTLSGAPKPRALEIIDELEPANRGIFGGVVGYFDFAGNADLAIAIRTAFIRDGKAHVQAGAGLVLDSNPESEYQETVTKAGAPLRAITLANSLKRQR